MAEEGKGVVATVKAIWVYPIKSCRGISIPQAPISPTGFRWDRQWLVVNSKGRAYTQRNEPKLALVGVELPNEAFSEDWEPNKHSYLVIKAPGMDVLKVPMMKSAETVDGVSVWEWSGSAVDEGAAAAQWFSNYLGKPSRLVRFNDASEVRPVDPNYARGYRVMFSDQYPFLLLSQGSLDALNALLREPVPINRFRPKYLPVHVPLCYPKGAKHINCVLRCVKEASKFNYSTHKNLLGYVTWGLVCMFPVNMHQRPRY